jgi:ankyrin
VLKDTTLNIFHCAIKHSLNTFCFILQVCVHLLAAVKYGDVKSTRRFVHCTSDSCSTDNHIRDTPLIIAVDKGDVLMVRALLEGGANTERTNNFQFTALHTAARFGHLDLCRLLLDWGAKVDPLDKWKYTPLHHAARNGHLSSVKLLAERRADVKLMNYFGRNASEEARRNGKQEVADWLDSQSS